MQIRPHTFRSADLVGGHVVLDLVNTVTARNADPVDWLDGYAAVLSWAALTGRFSRADLDALRRMSAADPVAAARSLERLRELREAVQLLVSAVIADERPAPEALARLEATWREALGAARLAWQNRRSRLQVGVESSRLDYIAHELALSAMELLQELPLDRTRVCSGSSCGWLFIDTSKAGRRRWCDMATCGNAAKSRRHLQRRRASRS
jgi:predicted RNA-binding Zn ribbon-like protein